MTGIQSEVIARLAQTHTFVYSYLKSAYKKDNFTRAATFRTIGPVQWTETKGDTSLAKFVVPAEFTSLEGGKWFGKQVSVGEKVNGLLKGVITSDATNKSIGRWLVYMQIHDSNGNSYGDLILKETDWVGYAGVSGVVSRRVSIQGN